MTNPVPPLVMSLLVELDTARAEGEPWCVPEGWRMDTLDFALKHQLIEANTVDGEDTEYRITPTGQKALCGEMPEAVVTDEPLGLPVNERLDLQSARLLKLLAEHGDWMPTKRLPKDIGYPTRALVQREGYVEGRGNTAQREFRITERGAMMLGQKHRVANWTLDKVPSTAEEQQKHIDAVKARVLAKKAAAESRVDTVAEVKRVEVIDRDEPESDPQINIDVQVHGEPEDVTSAIVQQMNDFADRVHPAPLPPMMHVIADSLPPEEHTCTDNCPDCVYRDVVELLERRVPGVREVVAGLKLVNRR